MYKKQSENTQMTIDDLILPFSGKLSYQNRWVKLAELIPQELEEKIYHKHEIVSQDIFAIVLQEDFGLFDRTSPQPNFVFKTTELFS